MEKKGTLASPATALASSVLPVRRSYQQSALGELGADIGIFLGTVQEVDDLRQGFLGLVLTGHIGKGDAGLLFHVDLGVGLAHAADPAMPPMPPFFAMIRMTRENMSMMNTKGRMKLMANRRSGLI